MSTAKDLLYAAFCVPRDERSYEYRQGVNDALHYRLKETTSIACPYRAGTAQADAWLSGTEEGRHIANAHLSEAEHV